MPDTPFVTYTAFPVPLKRSELHSGIFGSAGRFAMPERRFMAACGGLYGFGRIA